MVKNVLREIAIRQAHKQPHIVDAITEDSPILAMLPMQPATHGIVNVYESILDIKGAALVDLDDELPEIYVDSALKQADLSVIGGTIYVGTDKAKKFGGPAAYFNYKTPTVMRQSAARIERSLYYDNFRKFAIDNGKVIDAGGTGNANYSLVVVKWVPGENTGLYDANGFGSGKILETIPLSGGGVFKHNVDGKEVSVYGADLKTYFGLQLANPRYISSVVNITINPADGTTNLTSWMVNQAVAQARGTAGNTIIYCSPTLKTLLMSFKEARYIMTQETDYNTIIDYWNGIPIVDSYNIINDGTEPNA